MARLKEELELVSYTTSHDLQAPLRVISFYGAELTKHAGLTDDPEAYAAVQKIVRNAARMKALLQGLRDYLCLETFAPSLAPVDANDLVAAAIQTLRDKIQSAHAAITCDALPQIHGHRGRLTRLFTSLIDNALKFSVLPPVIHISARPLGGICEFCVADNGIGIDSDYHTIIFDLFNRLHTEKEYPGDGIGLALSQKIVQAHGGKLWVESRPGEGSHFKFTLPSLEETP